MVMIRHAGSHLQGRGEAEGWLVRIMSPWAAWTDCVFFFFFDFFFFFSTVR